MHIQHRPSWSWVLSPLAFGEGVGGEVKADNDLDALTGKNRKDLKIITQPASPGCFFMPSRMH